VVDCILSAGELLCLLPGLRDEILTLIEAINKSTIEVGSHFVLTRLLAHHGTPLLPLFLRGNRSLNNRSRLQELMRPVLRARVIEVNHFQIVQVVYWRARLLDEQVQRGLYWVRRL
jgi:hypothetical protein